MTSKPKPSVTSNPRFRQILWGWGISLAIILFFSGTFAITNWLPDDWKSQIAFYLGLFSIARLIGWIFVRLRGKARTIGEAEQKPAPPPLDTQKTKPAGLIESMILPVIGYALPLSIFGGLSNFFNSEGFTTFGVAAPIIFVLVLPFALFTGVAHFEASRPGQFGPESFKMPTKDDQNP